MKLQEHELVNLANGSSHDDTILHDILASNVIDVYVYNLFIYSMDDIFTQIRYKMKFDKYYLNYNKRLNYFKYWVVSDAN